MEDELCDPLRGDIKVHWAVRASFPLEDPISPSILFLKIPRGSIENAIQNEVIFLRGENFV